MNFILTAASVVSCTHPLAPIPVTGSLRLTVLGAGVLSVDSLAGTTVPPTSCVTVDNLPSSKKCTRIVTVTGGLVARLTVEGKPVLGLQGFDGTTDGVPPPVPPAPGLVAVPNQKFLTAGVVT
ncbi:hypothetical protein FXN61_12200 [Lentzea sp. PSKA42]|uniref:Secreted protein n=1 Tax=Lentzea indica TaxID=2604800 RepID=A0ABX1FFZ2_9PSEU|nr:hypothetical protein [Lentzea indica]NKE57556.1 hypothetical protein [Lentzea indica]